jgi:poly(3-hydroxybutyrate) depolymerase
MDRRADAVIYRSIPMGRLVEIFALDMRSYRGANSENLQTQVSADTAFLGNRQVHWLADALARSRATWRDFDGTVTRTSRSLTAAGAVRYNAPHEIAAMPRSILALLASLLAFASNAAGGTNVPGTYRHTIMLDGLQREFIVYVPAPGHNNAPAVFMLHGSGGDGEKFYNISGWREKADETGLIAIFPSGLNYCLKEDENHDGDFDDPGERKITTKWAEGEVGSPAAPLCTAAELAALPPEVRATVDHPLADDVNFFRTMLAVLDTNYSVNRRRVYVSGFSNGGGMASRLAMEMSESFAAVAAAAGVLKVPPVPAVRPLPFVFSVGELDDRFTGNYGVSTIPVAPTVYQDIPSFYGDTAAPMLTVTQIDSTYQYWENPINGANIANFFFPNSLVHASNVYWTMIIQGAGHQYPNGTNHPVVMADVLWKFFQRWTLTGP